MFAKNESPKFHPYMNKTKLVCVPKIEISASRLVHSIEKHNDNDRVPEHGGEVQIFNNSRTAAAALVASKAVTAAAAEVVAAASAAMSAEAAAAAEAEVAQQDAAEQPQHQKDKTYSIWYS